MISPMETKVVKVSEKLKLYEIQQNSIFLWKLEKTDVINEYMVALTFVRDDSVPHFDEIKKLEKEFHHSSRIPLPLLVVTSALAIILFTVFLIIYLVNDREIDMNVYFPSLVLPAILFTVTSGVLGMIRTKDVAKYINNSTSRFEEYKQKVQALVNETSKDTSKEV